MDIGRQSDGVDIVGNRTVRDFLTERASRYGDKTCLEFDAADGQRSTLSYRELLDQVCAVAGGFAADGIAKGDAVVIHLPNSPEFLLSWFGLVWIGAVAIPSNTANTATELRHILDHAGAVGVVTCPSYTETFRQVLDQDGATSRVRHRYVARSSEPTAGWSALASFLAKPVDPPEVDLAAEDLAELIFTSGTTALPKAVMLTHANLLHGGEREARSLFLDATDRSLTALPLFHVNAQSITTLSTLTVGGTVLLLEEYRATQFWQRVQDLQATMVTLVAMQVRTLLAQPPASTDRDHQLRRVMYAINVLDEEKEAFEKRFGVELINGYGLSEAFTLVTLAPVHGEKRWPSIGLPTLDRRVRIVDDEGHDVPAGEVGEIVVAGTPGRSIMQGYFHDPDATAAAIRDGWLHTGDNALMDAKGYVYFFDRLKDMIKTAGENVSASEVERILLTHPDIAEAAVIGIPHPIRDEVVKAYVVPAGDATLTSAAVIAHCTAHLARFKVPAEVEILDALPKTSIGKVEKKTLRQAHATAAASRD
jgi:crotonobetaine/carnitine-CoA ligase